MQPYKCPRCERWSVPTDSHSILCPRCIERRKAFEARRDPNCDTALDRDARNQDALHNRPEEMP